MKAWINASSSSPPYRAPRQTDPPRTIVPGFPLALCLASPRLASAAQFLYTPPRTAGQKTGVCEGNPGMSEFVK